MGYALKFSPEGLASLQGLEPWLQEDVLDEADAMAGDPLALVARGFRPGYVHDFTREAGGFTHYIFLLFDRDDSASLLTMTMVGYVCKSTSTPADAPVGRDE